MANITIPHPDMHFLSWALLSQTEVKHLVRQAKEALWSQAATP